jgi:hypothetical protein
VCAYVPEVHEQQDERLPRLYLVWADEPKEERKHHLAEREHTRAWFTRPRHAYEQVCGFEEHSVRDQTPYVVWVEPPFGVCYLLGNVSLSHKPARLAVTYPPLHSPPPRVPPLEEARAGLAHQAEAVIGAVTEKRPPLQLQQLRGGDGAHADN